LNRVCFVKKQFLIVLPSLKERNHPDRPSTYLFTAPTRTDPSPERPGGDDKKRQSTENRRKSFKFTSKYSPHRTALFLPHINAAPLALDYSALNLLRQKQPSWNLLCTRHAPILINDLTNTVQRPVKLMEKNNE